MIDNFRTLKGVLDQLNFILNKEQKRKSIRVLGIIIISSFFELLGVTAVLPFMQAMLSADKLAQNKYVAVLIDFFHIRSTYGILVLMSAGLILLYIIKNLFLLYSNYKQADFSTLVQKQLSVKMLHSYLSKPYTYFLNTNSAIIIRGISSDTTSVYSIISAIFTMIVEMMTVILIAFYILITDAIIAFGVIGLSSIALILMILLFKPKLKNAGNANREAAAKRNKFIYHIVNGIKEILVMQRKESFIKQYETAADISRISQRSYDSINASPERIIEGVCVSGLIGIVCVRIGMGIDVIAFVPKLAAFAMAAFKILPSIGKITSRISTIVYFRPSLQCVYDTMKDAAKWEKQLDKYTKQKNMSKDFFEGAELSLRTKVEIDSISWKYPDSEKDVLQNISLEINKGEAVALIGTSGAGKTTLADIILGLFQPQSGSVQMDGIDIFSIPVEWAKVVGYVPQTVFLLDDTIRNNVLFGIPREETDDVKVWEALRKAQLLEFVESLPNGLDTIVGERGVKFSGGQRQRVAIARALFSDPEILVLDEATSALDSETEEAVMEAIETFHGEKTLIIVAHRLSTIRNCDKIYEINGGRAEERDKNSVVGI